MSNHPPTPWRPRHRWPPAALAATAWLLLAGCFQNAAPPEQEIRIVEARATSSTSFQLRFSDPLGAGADVAQNYLIRDPDGVMLPVVAAYPFDGGAAVALATESQADVAYDILVRNVALRSGTPVAEALETAEPVRASSAPAPVVSQVVPLSNTKVLVTFGDASGESLAHLNDDALNPAAYAFEPALEVRDAAFSDDGADRGRVLLTTGSMEGATYRLRVGFATAGEAAALLDPFRSERSFDGIAAKDETPPRITGAYASDARTVIMSFNEPVGDTAGDPSRYRIEDGAGETVSVSAATVGVHGYRVTLATSALDERATYTLFAQDVPDLAGNKIVAGSSATFAGVPSASDGRAPRVTGATSTGPTRVLVSFSEPVRGGVDSAENPEHYSIVGSDTLEGSLATQAVLSVTDAVLAGDGRRVALTTRPQSEIEYTLRIANVVDLDGNAVSGPTREHPFEIEFFGTAESGSGTDSDGDGLTDAAEERGWTVTVVDADGSSSRREVTSDPALPDTDKDGVPDAVERTNRTDPRAADTDADGLTDARELNEVYSSPIEADSDGDGLSDGLEANDFGTSPLMVDTDGDQLSDDYEIVTDNRDPRIADMPAVTISVGTVDLQLDVRFEERSAQGTSVLDSRSVDTTLSQSRESAQSRETSTTLEWFAKAGASACVSGGCEGGKTWGLNFTAEGGASGSSSTTFTNTSVQASQREYATSLTTDRETSAESEIVRVVEGATMAVEVGIANASNLSFTIQDIEITALVQDTADPGVYVPVATLYAASRSPINIGPLDPTRGPFRFEARDAYPQLVESLMRNPRGLIFRVANKEITDEFGRNFAYVEQDVNDRTAFLEIGYAGNAPLERYQVATNATFGVDLQPMGVTFAHVMEEILDLAYVPEAEDVALDPTDAEDAELIAQSYSTRAVAGVDTLWRVRGVSRELTGLERDWWVLGPEGNITPVGTRPGWDFRSYTVASDQDFAFTFEQDLDADDLSAQEELSYRSIDSAADEEPADGVPDSRDTDRDGIDDGDEVYGPFVGIQRQPWRVRLEDGRDAYVTQAHPGRVDADGDGLTDCQELALDETCADIDIYLDEDDVPTLASASDEGIGHDFLTTTRLASATDPSNPDTDGDGLSDAIETIGFRYDDLQGHDVTLHAGIDAGEPWATNPLDPDTDRDGLNDRAEVRLGSNPLQPDGDTVRDDDADGLVNAVELGGWSVAYRTVGGGTQHLSPASDPGLEDTDGDGLTDWEEYTGCRDADRDGVCDDDRRFGSTHPERRDTDEDGVEDRIEVDGADFPSDVDDPIRVLDPLDQDSDGDGRSDGDELDDAWSVDVVARGGYQVWSDPLRADADGDGLNDLQEEREGTDPNEADSDEDGTLDGLESTRPTNPLERDHLVTVTYLSLQAGKGSSSSGADGDSDYTANPGDFRFAFSVRIPTPGGDTTLRTVTGHGSVDAPTCAGSDDNLCWRDTGGSGWIQIASPRTFTMSASTTFALPYTALFSIEGWVQEIDTWEDGSTYADISYHFGGAADANAVLSGSDVKKGASLLAFHDEFDGTPLDVTVQIQVQ